MSSKENIWLVKSGTYILGPFNYDSVVEKLLDRSLSPRDEISAHLKYWLPINDEPAFAKPVEDLRLLSLAEDDDDHTHVNTVANFTITEDLSTPELEKRKSFSAIEMPNVQKPVQNSIKEKQLPSETRADHNKINPVSYKEQNPSKSSSLMWLAVVIVIGVLGFTVYKDNLKFSGSAQDAADLFKQGRVDLKLSKYIEATNSFKKHLAIEPKNQEAYFYLAQAYISAGQQSEARSIINNENYTEITEDIRANLLGLTFLKEDEVIVSEKYFTKSLNNNPDYVPALVNSSIANHKVGKNNISLMRLNKSLKAVNQYPEVSFLYIMRVLDEYKVTENKKSISKAQDFINKQFSENFVLYQESQLLSSFIELHVSQKISDSQTNLIKIIDNDPDEFSQLTFSHLIDNRAIGWGELVKICNTVAAAFDDVSSTALLSYCRYKNNKYQLAKDVLAINLEKDPSNPLFLALNSLYASKLGEKEISKESLKRSLIENNKLASSLALPYILKLNSCLTPMDQKCIELYSSKLMAVKANSLLAQQALANLSFTNKNYNESHRIASKASIQAENYLPIQNILMKLGPYVK